MGAIHSAEVERLVGAPLPLVWAVVADSHRRNRMMSGKPVSYDYQLLGQPASSTRVGHSRLFGLEMSWVEEGELVEGGFLRGERRFLEGPMGKLGFYFEVVRAGEGTRVKASFYVELSLSAPEGMGVIVQAQLQKVITRYFDALAPVLEAVGALPGAGDRSEPPASLARRLFLALELDAFTGGAHATTDEKELEFRARRLAAAPVDERIRERLVQHLRSRPDDDVVQMRPFELARAWAADRSEALRAFLHAARAGLVDLRWQINCPSCRVAAGFAAHLAEVAPQSHCDECDVDYAVDFAENVEAVFDVNRAIRAVEPQLYCASSPWFRPHLFAQLRATPGETREVRVELPRGLLLVRQPRSRGRAAIAIGPIAPERLVVRAGSSLSVEAHGSSADGLTRLELGTDGEEATVAFERAGWNADIVLGSVIATMPEFHDLFGTEAPAVGAELTVGSLSVLFSDLTGTTALYEQLGDAKAFALVESHFRELAQVAAAHGGAVVKTMGDAVMATFARPSSALQAGLEMIARVEALAHQHGLDHLQLKVGLHEGPCLAVRANERLDFFGSTVNVAARLQGQARPGQLVIAASLSEHPEVRRLMSEKGLRVEHFRAELKGVRQQRALLALTPVSPITASTRTAH
jgi:class 3 adenylate cyclase